MQRAHGSPRFPIGLPAGNHPRAPRAASWGRYLSGLAWTACILRAPPYIACTSTIHFSVSCTGTAVTGGSVLVLLICTRKLQTRVQLYKVLAVARCRAQHPRAGRSGANDRGRDARSGRLVKTILRIESIGIYKIARMIIILLSACNR